MWQEKFDKKPHSPWKAVAEDTPAEKGDCNASIRLPVRVETETVVAVPIQGEQRRLCNHRTVKMQKFKAIFPFSIQSST